MAVASLVLLSLVACISRGVDSPASPEPPVLAPARIAEILASPDRNQTDRTNDLRRKPYDMLNFIAIRPGMVALDLSADYNRRDGTIAATDYSELQAQIRLRYDLLRRN